MKLDLEDEYEELIKHVMVVRRGEKNEEKFIYTNITFQNQIVLKKVRQKFFECGNEMVLNSSCEFLTKSLS